MHTNCPLPSVAKILKTTVITMTYIKVKVNTKALEYTCTDYIVFWLTVIILASVSHKNSGNPISSARSTAVMEAYFPRKALTMHVASLHFEPPSIYLSATIVSTGFDKNTVWVHQEASAGDFIRTLPGTLSRLILPQLHRFVLLRGVYGATGSSVKLDACKNCYITDQAEHPTWPHQWKRSTT